MTLPDQVKAQKERIEKHFAEQQAEESPPVEDPPAESVEGAESVEEASPVGDPPTEPAEDSPPVEGPPAEPAEEPWEQRYKTLQGVFNKKLPEAQEANRQLQARVSQLENLIAQMDVGAKSQPGSGEPPQTLLTDEDRNDYGSALDVMKRAAREEVREELSAMQAEINRLQGMIPQTQNTEQVLHEMRWRDFQNDLHNRVPEFEKLNHDENFMEWLLQNDPLTGTQRSELLTSAWQTYDAARTAAFFDEYKRSTGSVAGSPNPAKNGNGVQSELAHQIAPGKGRSLTPAPAANQEEPITPAFIKNFFDRVTRGDFKKMPEEKARIEKRIFAELGEAPS